MPANARTIDLLVEAFDLNQRRKFELKNDNGDVIVDLFFKPITRCSCLASVKRLSLKKQKTNNAGQLALL